MTTKARHRHRLPQVDTMIPQDRVAATPEEMQEAMGKDRGCCFLAFYHATKELRAFQRTTIICEECRMHWLLQRIGEMGLQMFPIGVVPRVAVVQKLDS